MDANFKKGFATSAIISIAAVVLVLGGVVYYASKPKVTNKADEEKAVVEKGIMEQKGNNMTTGKKNDAMVKEEPVMQKEGAGMMDTGEAMAKPGSYEAYSQDKLALAENGKVVLFFRASWCPTCRALDANIRSNLGTIPAGVTILDVDYDNSTALKKKYGVTYQHTLVQVGPLGEQLAKWTGSPTLADLVSKIK